MKVPEVAFFGDRYYQRVIYGLGPYIADYEEQVLLACIVRNWCVKCLAFCDDLDAEALLHERQHVDALVEEFTLTELWDQYGIVGDLVPFTKDFPYADIQELLSPDLLHQIIKGGFKDHLVKWVEKNLHHHYGKAEAERRLDDIDRQIAVVAPFAGLQCFPQGHHFKQWTGDDSKGLMKIYLTAIEGHVPPEIVRTFRAFLELCYLVRRNVITEGTLMQIEESLAHFHKYHKFF
ncbi:hypothetical protein PAXINDRAFT_15782 [Paxillus involutus ATCC 200175]|uniref:Uncharacterized protein n=1 Tax=Paxillus involutus ATCC 200175 TaxID=664439 RepID=A0A0C9T6H3_PAXIN|nr:hypothetical protein PAXINDRAFT_15782 [Paxillus involutus ATCC 200175]